MLESSVFDKKNLKAQILWDVIFKILTKSSGSFINSHWSSINFTVTALIQNIFKSSIQMIIIIRYNLLGKAKSVVFKVKKNKNSDLIEFHIFDFKEKSNKVRFDENSKDLLWCIKIQKLRSYEKESKVQILC